MRFGFVRFIRLEVLVLLVMSVGLLLIRLSFVLSGVFDKTLLALTMIELKRPSANAQFLFTCLRGIFICRAATVDLMSSNNRPLSFASKRVIIQLQN